MDDILIWLKIALLLVILFILIGFIYDQLIGSKYEFRNFKLRMRTYAHKPGSGSTYYIRYWIWERYKKKYAINALKNKHVVDVYKQHAQSRKWARDSKIPFLCEVYGTPER